ncbi:(2Fe-2S)-binding protein, partial [Streptomyces sp. NPDC085540]
VGLAHAASNVAAVACYAVSLTSRLRGRPAKGRLWSLGGLAAVAVTGALGGHMAYRGAVGGYPAA